MDPRETIARSPMTAMQMLVVGITIGLNALDGFDVLSISFASPGIAAEWGIDRAELGLVLSMELIGMAVGSVLLGGVADRLGRRRTMLGCLVAMAVGMFMATTVRGVVDLSFWRVLTGLGIGGMLAAINAVAAEFSNVKRRHLSVSLMSIGYPIGAVVGGLVVARLLQGNDWRVVFYFGAGITACFIPLVYFFVPESVHWLVQKQPSGALAQVNRSLGRLGYAAVSALPAITAAERKQSIGDIFGPALRMVTILVTAAYFFHILTFYFIVKWVPTLVVELGFDPSTAATVLVWVNVGGATGGALLGLLTLRFSVKALTIAAMIVSTVMVALFGRTGPDFTQLALVCFLAGFGTNSAIVGMYAIFAHAFPTHVRAFGTGFAIGIGRGGAALGPIVGGILFQAGYGRAGVALLRAAGSLVAAVMILLLRLEPDRPAGASARAPRTDLRGAHAEG